MKHIFLIFFLFIGFISCNNDKPGDIVSTDKMEAILWDIILADEMISQKHQLDSTVNKKKMAEELYGQVFSIHKISYKEFQKNFQYYQSRPDLLKTIFDSLSVKTPNIRRTIQLEL